MNIRSISTNKLNLVGVKRTANVAPKENNSNLQQTSFPIVSANYYVSFGGGYSLNLSETMRNFEEMEALNDKKVVPERVREIADYVLEAGNPNDLTLIDIHKKAYEDIKHVDSLDEVRVRYPEFADVLAVEDINVRDDSFIGEIKAGKSQVFDKDDDLTLELMKLYWAEGFSLTDLEKYTNGKKNLAYVMQRLNIPRLNSHYGHILKFSDKEYNERMTAEMATRRADYFEKKQGHMLIPRGPLSEEHREKISVSLIEYYIKNPERVYLQSERQKEFYRNNPEAVELFNLVINDAWNLGSSRPVKDALSKFLSKRGIEAQKQQTLNPLEMSARQKVLMQEFWATNPQAKEKFSVSMKCAWKRIKAYQEVEKNKISTPIPAYPIVIQNHIKKWAEQNGYDSELINFNLTTFVGSTKGIQNSKGAKIVGEYFEKHDLMADIYADSICYSLAVFRDYLLSPTNRSAIGDAVISKIERGVRGKKEMAARELVALYIDVVKTMVANGKVEELKSLIGVLQNSYGQVVSMRWRAGMPVPKDI